VDLRLEVRSAGRSRGAAPVMAVAAARAEGSGPAPLTRGAVVATAPGTVEISVPATGSRSEGSGR
jgi:hypothetical protein